MLNTMMEDNEILITDIEQEFDIDILFQSAMIKDWKEVLTVYQKYPLACKARLTKSEETALHIAVSSYHADQTDADKHAEVVRQLVDAIPKGQEVDILLLKNDKGNTPLHLAAALGSVSICEKIASVNARKLIYNRNLKGETPLFLAARHGKIEAFLRLRAELPNEDKEDDSVCRRRDGNTILHSAISGEYFELAFQIISSYPRLVNFVNEEGFSPLHMLARKPNLFESSSNLRLCDRMIYKCVTVRELKKHKIDSKSEKISSCCQINDSYPKNYQTCLDFMYLFWSAFKTIASVGKDCRTKRQTGGPTDEENQNKKSEEHQASVGKDCRTKRQTGGTTDEKNQKTKPEEHQAGKELRVEDSFPPNYRTCIQLFKFAMNLMLVVLGIGIKRISKIREKKKKHEWAVQIMTKLIKKESHYKYGNNGRTPTQNLKPLRQDVPEPPPLPPDQNSGVEENMNRGKEDKDENKTGDIINGCMRMDTNNELKDGTHVSAAETKDVKATSILLPVKNIIEMMEKILDKINELKDSKHAPDAKSKDVKETSLLLAAKMGITEMVKKILDTFPVAIQDLDANGKNALLLAVENRQTKVYDLLRKMKLPEFVLYQVDDKGNSAVHLAAMFQKHHPWRIPGAALQMQWEIKWYKYVKNSMPPQCFIQHNKEGETASEIFRKTHESLVKDGSEWIIKTSESCSVVAALIATVAFATSSTVPGGPDQNTGRPLLENQPAFDVFSVASLVALCFSVTALVFFLAILTSRCQQQDFKHSLPRKLLLGLTSLFTSITAILISFCAGHFFILKDQMHNAAFPIYAVACLPITFFAFAQLPLYFDLLWSISRKVPLRSYKVFYN